VLECWYELYSREPETPIDIAEFSLWDNKFLLIDNKPVYIRSWDISGVNLIRNILDDEGNILTKQLLQTRNNFVIKQMEYNSIVHAIPKHRLEKVHGKNLAIRNNPPATVLITQKAKVISDVTCRDCYWEYIYEISEIPKAEKKWESYLNVASIQWQEHYAIPFKICRDTVLQSFQYKIFHRFFPCNYTLSVWYKDHSSICDFCNEIDYPEHYFCNCSETFSLWTAIQKWWKSVLEITIQITECDILFGIANPNDDTVLDILNLCIIYAKWYIYNCKKR